MIRCARIVGFLVLALLVGCGKSTPPTTASPEPKEAKKEKKALPDIPGAEKEEDTGSSPVLIKQAAANRELESTYTQAGGLPSGTLRGVCFIRPVKGKPLPKNKRLEFTGKYAIKDPMTMGKGTKVVTNAYGGKQKEPTKTGDVKTEVDYYKNMGLSEPGPARWIQGYDRKMRRHPVNAAVITIPGIKAGGLAPLNRPSFMVRQGRFTFAAGVHRGQQGANRSTANIHFCPTGDKVVVMSADLFPCEVAVVQTSTGKELYKGTAQAYSDPKRPGMIYAAVDWMAKPKMIQSVPLKEPGLYEVRCIRHPWQMGYLHVLDNPYVQTTTHHGRGKFSIGSIPAGKHTIEVWHQALEPVKKKIEVEIRPNETTDVLVEFKMPEAK